MFRSIILITTAIVAVSFGTAHADAPRQITLKLSGLNLNSPRDVQRLYDRVVEGASEVCGRGSLTVFFPAPPPEFLACRDAAIDATLSQIHTPLVQALRKDKANDRLSASAPLAGVRH